MTVRKSKTQQFPFAPFALAAITSLSLLAVDGTALAQDADNSGQDNRHFIRSLELSGKQALLRISNPGRTARPVCASTLDDLLQSQAGAARLSGDAEWFYFDIDVRWNPNNLKYQSAYYLISPVDGYALSLSCKLDDQLDVTFNVEAVSTDGALSDEAKASVNGHFRYFGSQLEFAD